MLFGGESTEHEISIVSARNVRAAIDTTRFDVTLGFIDKEGKWWLVDEIVDTKPDNAAALQAELGSKAFVAKGETYEFDVILPVLHGPNGEDGSVQALAQLQHIPIVGCDMTASATAMNKYITKQIARANNIPTVSYEVYRRGDQSPVFETLAQKLGSTLFVKPARAGSSVGVSKVRSQTELDQAIKEAQEYDSLTLIETAVSARELEVGVLGNYPEVAVSSIGEIKPDREFYSYESKYDQASSSEVIIPAEITDDVKETIQSYARQIFNAIGGSGLSRIDFFYSEDGQILFNEINTIPGFTDISMYSKLWLHEGMKYPDLITKLVELALIRHTVA